MRTAIGVQERSQSTLIEGQFVRTANGHACLWKLALLLTIPRNAWVVDGTQSWRLDAVSGMGKSLLFVGRGKAAYDQQSCDWVVYDSYTSRTRTYFVAEV
jgi:hypothetical protein